MSIEEMRAAAGVTGSGSDTALRAMERRVAASIMSECNIAVGAGSPPTLLRETLTETFYQACGETLILSRRHDVTVTSIVEDAVTLVDADFMADPESGMVTKLCSDYPTWWSARKVVVVYGAGFETVPEDLKMAAADFFRSSWMEQSRDPLVKSQRENVPGLLEKETAYWVGSVPGQSNEGAVPDLVAGQLKRFRNVALA
ncbi:hypothetical protein [Mesorhizobium sp. B263B2A]|uniref:hypothetical protein n=1 Tax=Mesorhizobium sp. B263B2A TaxID=2876669 RepID=UPI001CD08A12|nr:hypothetical protein [Mesorhizobium sp. B263B2A]MCA0032755.1 hypothetical protein [Mesorhizobium sp. B263B2A]